MPGLNEYQMAQLLKETDPKVLEIAGKFNVPVHVARAYLEAQAPGPPVSVQAPYAPVPGEGGFRVNAQYAPIADPNVKVIAPKAAVPGDNIVLNAHRAPEVDPEHPLAPLAALFTKEGYKYDPDYESSLSPRTAPGFRESVPEKPKPFKSDEDPEVFEAKKRMGSAYTLYMLTGNNKKK